MPWIGQDLETADGNDPFDLAVRLARERVTVRCVMTEPRPKEFTIDLSPVLPPNWREQLAIRRKVGYPNSPMHQWAYRNFVRACFPKHIDTTNPEVLDQIEWWWVLTQLERDGVWRSWLMAQPDEEE